MSNTEHGTRFSGLSETFSQLPMNDEDAVETKKKKNKSIQVEAESYKRVSLRLSLSLRLCVL